MNHSLKKLVQTFFTLMSLVGLSACTHDREVQFLIDPAQHYQTMNGWEVTPRLWEFDKKADRYDPSWADYREAVYDQLVSRGGINRIRLAVMSGAENPVDYWSQFVHGEIGYKAFQQHFYEKINDNDDPTVTNPDGIQFSFLDDRIDNIVLPLQRRLAARGERLIINFCYMDFRWSKLQGNMSHANQPEEYAEFILAMFRHMRDKYQLIPDSLQIILEPDNTLDWRGKQIGEALVTVARQLADEDFHPDFVAPSTSRLTAAQPYFDEMIQVPGVSELLNTFSYHRYGSNQLSRPLQQEYLRGIARRAAQYQLDTAMLEYLSADVSDLIDDLTIANNSAWQIWSIATAVDEFSNQQGTMLLTDAGSPADHPDIRLTERSRFTAPFFRSVRSQALRIGAQSTDPQQRAVAFINSDGNPVVLLDLHGSENQKLQLFGLPEGQYAIEFTDASGAIKDLGTQPAKMGKSLDINSRGRGIMRIYRQPPAS